MNNIQLEPKLVGSIEGEFYVPAYQRGYRWKEEVKMLLNDIHEIGEGKNYSLQPIVVRKIDEKKFELIDGQQRLTSIYLIFRYMKQLNLPQNKPTHPAFIHHREKNFPPMFTGNRLTRHMIVKHQTLHAAASFPPALPPSMEGIAAMVRFTTISCRRP